MRAPACLLALAPLLATVSLGCGPDEGNPGGDGSRDPGPSLCADDPRVQAYSVDLAAQSADGKLTVRLAGASPAPPAKGDNVWTISLFDADDEPVDGATIATKPFMPDHAHGSSIVPQMKRTGSPGEYTLEHVNFFMPGVWEVTLTIASPKLPDETVVFTFCVDG